MSTFNSFVIVETFYFKSTMWQINYKKITNLVTQHPEKLTSGTRYRIPFQLIVKQSVMTNTSSTPLFTCIHVEIFNLKF